MCSIGLKILGLFVAWYIWKGCEIISNIWQHFRSLQYIYPLPLVHVG